MSGNSNPVITSSNATGSFSEDANTTGSTVDHVLTGTMNFTDSNKTDTHTTTSALKTAVWSGGSSLPTGALAKFQAGMTSSIISDSNGSGKLRWTFSEDDRDFDFLAKNETLVLTYEVTLKDNKGGSTKKTVTITVTGTDDKPVFASTAGATLSEQANKTLSLSLDTANIALQFTDVDLNNTGHTADVLSVSAAGNTSGLLPGSFGNAQLMSYFDIQNVVKNAGSSNGTVNTKFSAPDLAFDYLAAGEQLVITYVVEIDDKKGGVSTQNVVVTINGTNDKPVVIGLPECENLTEGQDLSGGNLVADGHFHFTDIDLSDTHTVSTTVSATRSGGGAVPISEADLIAAMGAALYDDPDAPGNPDDSTGDLFGKVVWSFALGDDAVDFLAEGEVLTLEYDIIVTDPSGASDTERVTIKIVGANEPVVTKTASVPGGTANVAGEVISYDITVANEGISTLTGITVTDPSVTDLAAVDANFDGFNDGDADLDNQLDAGESWHYTASYTVTPNDIATLGNGSGFIQNTVTVGSDQAAPVTASTAVVVENTSSVDLTKTADVSSVDAAGDVIHYTITATNTGLTALSNVQVTDPQVNIFTPIIDPAAPVPGAELLAQVLDGDYNVGDTNENGFEDSGETFVYVNAGDFNQNGIIEPDQGEMALFTNIGDTNQNGFQDGAEVFQYYNAGDTNQNGVEDSGETFQFSVSHAATYVSGDADNDGLLDVGETWTYSVNYTVTQDDIDNGGVVDPGLSHDNTATVTTDQGVGDDASASVAIAQDPRVSLTKSAVVADGTADEAGDVINYTINVANVGNMTLTGVTVTDPSVSGLAYVSGDTDADNMLDLAETWVYTASHTVTQDDIDNGGVVDPALTYDNTASVTTDQGGADADANDSDSASVPIVQDARISLTKSAVVADGTADEAGDIINYTINVANAGNMTLTGVTVTDPSVSDLAYVSGDTDSDNELDLTETWVYTASHTVTQADIDNGGVVDPALSYDNTASVTTDQGADDADANDSDSASVPIVQSPSIALDKTATVPGGSADTVGEVVSYAISVTNDGNMSLTGVSVSDPSVSDLTRIADLVGNNDNILNLGETWQYTASHTVTQNDLDTNGGGDGTIDNTASVTTGEGASDSDSASVPVVAATFSMTIDKIALGYVDNDNDNAASAGDTLVYQFIVTNTGTGTQTNIQVSDVGPEIATVTGGTLTSLAPGDDSGDFWEGTYTITSADLTDGVDNEAVANSDQGNAVSGTIHTILAGLNELPI